MLREMLAMLSSLEKWWHSCPYLNTATASELQRTREVISIACLHLSHLGLSTSSIFNRCPFRWQCPVSSPFIILIWFFRNHGFCRMRNNCNTDENVCDYFIVIFILSFQLSVKNCFIRGSVVRYVQLPADEVDTQLLQDAARKEAAVQSR